MRVEIRNAEFQYPNTPAPTFQNLGFELSSGEVLAVLGRNGVGKTTLVKCLTGILTWASAELFIDGERTHLDELGNKIGYVPQRQTLAYPYTVREVVLMGRARHMGALSIPSRADRAKAEDVISLMGLESIAGRRSDELSGGQLQMVLIARALASTPDILVMDEPETGLDFKNQNFIMELVLSLVRERNIACIINTHFPDTALKIADKALLLGRGEYMTGPVSEVITAPNMDNFFDVRTAITYTEIEGEEYGSFFVVGDR